MILFGLKTWLETGEELTTPVVEVRPGLIRDFHGCLVATAAGQSP